MELIVLLMLSGLVVGALGRFALPGPNPMSLWVTMLIGIVASIVTGVIIAALGLPDRLDSSPRSCARRASSTS